MTTNSNKDPFKLLEQVQRVEAPAYLLNRVYEQLDQNERDKNISPNLLWLSAVAAALFLAINVWAMVQFQQNIQVQKQNIVLKSMQLMPNPQFYLD